MLGCGFDHDPQYPWAGKILNNQEIVDEKQRADSLGDKCWHYMYSAGEDYTDRQGNIHFVPFFKNFRKLEKIPMDALVPSKHRVF